MEQYTGRCILNGPMNTCGRSCFFTYTPNIFNPRQDFQTPAVRHASIIRDKFQQGIFYAGARPQTESWRSMWGWVNTLFLLKVNGPSKINIDQRS